MEEKQQEMRKRLAAITVEGNADGLVVRANANREILNVSIPRELLAAEDPEQLEDLIVVAANRALQAAAEVETREAENLLKDMMPPGMGNLGDLFG
jgi:DNA-binding protein YbaB